MEVHSESLDTLNCNTIVPCSPVVIPKYLSYFPWLRTKVHYINGFFDRSRLYVDDSLSTSLNIQFPDGYILVIGRLDSNKSVLKVIQAYQLYCSLLSSSINPIPLLIVGSGPLEVSCETSISYFNQRINSVKAKSLQLIFYRKETHSAYTYINNASSCY